MTRRCSLWLALAALSACALNVQPAVAESKYPERPIRLVIPFPPGGVNDAVGRPWADKVKPLLGTVVVDNQGGAGGTIGAAAVAHARPDGYTILLGGGSTLVINPIATLHPAYDPISAFEPIALLAISGLGIVVHPALPVNSLKELIDYAKGNSNKLSFGATGVGAVTHMGAELFKSLTGTQNIVTVQYKGAGPMTTDLVGGQIPMAMPNVTGQLLTLHQAGKLRLLAVTTTHRLITAADIPTAVEAGLPGMIVQNFTGLFAPARTPHDIVQQIAQATYSAIAEPDVQRLLIASGLEPYLDSTPEKTGTFVREEITRWTPIVKAIGLKLD